MQATSSQDKNCGNVLKLKSIIYTFICFLNIMPNPIHLTVVNPVFYSVPLRSLERFRNCIVRTSCEQQPNGGNVSRHMKCVFRNRILYSVPEMISEKQNGWIGSSLSFYFLKQKKVGVEKGRLEGRLWLKVI